MKTFYYYFSSFVNSDYCNGAPKAGGAQRAESLRPSEPAASLTKVVD
jgi:hypothetical protein